MTLLRRPFIAGFSATLVLVLLTVLRMPGTASAATAKHPNLKTLAPSSLQFDTEVIDGATHWVLRFSNTVWNAGTGPLELLAAVDTSTGATKTRVTQRVYNTDGTWTDSTAGYFEYHQGHDHFHFGNFAEYELWPRAEYDAWVASGRSRGQAQRRGAKTTFCIMDTGRVQALPDSPSSAVYRTCNPNKQGLSVGWGDTYGYRLPEQWIDLGTSRLADGSYVLRSIADPKNLLIESNENDQEAVRFFRVRNRRISNE